MIKKYLNRTFLLLVTLAFLQGCVEPYEFETDIFEDYLVLEATITDELRHHEVHLQRTYELDEDVPPVEQGADVQVVDDAQNIYQFVETDPGLYVSEEEFAAQRGRTYKIEIWTRDGSFYTSNPVETPEKGEIEEVYASRTTNNGQEGVAIQIDSDNPDGSSNYYMYKFEETYKIVSNFTSHSDLAFIDNELVVVPKTREEEVCYNTISSNEIILGNTSSLSGNNLEGFLVRFIDRKNPVLSRRYSILVKQYALSREAYAYFSTLEKISGSESVFSQNQPGFINGNVFSPENPEDKVIGYFNVASVSEKRTFFNYSDFFESEFERPVFVENCTAKTPGIVPDANKQILISMIETGRWKYLGPNQMTGNGTPTEGPFIVIEAPCVDCTRLGTNVEPSFWEE